MAMFTDFSNKKKKKNLTDLGDQVAFSGSDPVVFEGGCCPPTAFTDTDDHLGLISKHC